MADAEDVMPQPHPPTKQQHLQNEGTKTKTKTALITGAGGGLLGRSITCLYLAARGWQILAADYNESALSELKFQALQLASNIVPIWMDVSNQKPIDLAFQQIVPYLPVSSLNAIVNFAGILRLGSMVEMPEAELQRVLDVNLLGTYRVNKIFLKLLSPNARIVNISSETGWMSGGFFNGAYAMSKHAMEAYSDSLRRELMFLDIPVIKIQPGPFRTAMTKDLEATFQRAIQESNLFPSELQVVRALALQETSKSLNDPIQIARTVHRALTVPIPRQPIPFNPIGNVPWPSACPPVGTMPF